MFRKVFFFAVLGFVGHQTQAMAQDSYSIWYTSCPKNWKLLQVVNTPREASQALSQLKASYPSYHFQSVPNYNGSRIPPSTNPCGTSGGGTSGGGTSGGGYGGGYGGGNNCYGTVDYPIYGILNAQGQVYNNMIFCCRSTLEKYYYDNFVLLRNSGYTRLGTGSVRWNSCSQTVYGCRNGQVVALPKSQYSVSGWSCR